MTGLSRSQHHDTHPTQLCAGLLVRAAAVLAFVAFPVAASAMLSDALDFCLDTSLTIDDRGAAFEAAGWTRSGDMSLADDALAEAILLSGLDPLQPDDWAEAQVRAQEIALSLRERRGHDAVQLFLHDDEAVIVEPTQSGNATCLYLGPPQDLSEAASRVGERMAVRRQGDVLAVAGRPPAAQLNARALAPEALSTFPVAPEYGAAVTIVLDSRPSP